MLKPHLEILPEAQLRLWPELADTPSGFVLYGGTAVALRLGHRASVDFDFFGFEPFSPAELFANVPYLRGGTIVRAAPNTLTCRIARGGPVLVSLFGLTLGQVAEPETVEGPGIAVAMPIDLAGCKVAVVTQRAEVRDYVDVHALLRSGISLPEMLSAGVAIYGPAFSPFTALKALAYHDDPALSGLSAGLRRDLARAVATVDLAKLPVMDTIRRRQPPFNDTQ